MEDEWIADRVRLRHLQRAHPTWRIRDLAAALHRSAGWVQKWLRRFRAADPEPEFGIARQGSSYLRSHQ